MRALTALSITIATSVGIAFLACSTEDDAQDTLCDPGTNVFCRCVDMSAGTKKCKDDGQGFGPCRAARGSCDELPDDGQGGTTPQPPPPGELLAVCAEDTECGGGMICPMGYCTKPCATYEECERGDCVQFPGYGALCVPYCTTQNDCSPYGAKVMCGFTTDALPPAMVVVCARWGDDWMYPSDDYPCTEDFMCSTGMEWLERVCQDETCTDGCHQKSDCPPELDCSSSSTSVLGVCGGVGGTGGTGGTGGGGTGGTGGGGTGGTGGGGTGGTGGGGTGGTGGSGGSTGDFCPGEHIDISFAADFVQRSGDTCAWPISDYDPVDPCWNGSIASEDYVYEVLSADSGYLYIGITPAATYDTQMYARSTCGVDTSQIDCIDEEGAGGYELFVVPVTGGVPIWLIVDGYYLSCGTYDLEIFLSAT